MTRKNAWTEIVNMESIIVEYLLSILTMTLKYQKIIFSPITTVRGLNRYFCRLWGAFRDNFVD